VSPCGFSYGHYRDLLRSARERYAFASFDEPPTGGKPFILLRHDLDFSLEPALILARLEAELQVRSTYFVLLHAHYNPFGDPAFASLREIVGLGHRLGLHYDPSFYARNELPASETIRRESATLEDRFGSRVSVVAAHNPGRAPRPDGLDLGGLLDAYSPAFTVQMKYLSDSCQFWREGCACGFIDPSRYPRLQVLVHPIWWSEEGRLADESLRAETETRVAAAREEERRVLDHYAGLEHLGNRKLFRREGA
jgi:hypothetical protein